MKMYVGNLPFSTDEQELRGVFEEHGTVDSVAIITDRDTGRSRGFGFVEMPDDQAKAAMEALDNSMMGGRNLKVNEARPRTPRPRW
jgi:RNA recognition motif-containing protein